MIPLPALFRKEKTAFAMLSVDTDCQQQEYDYEKIKPQTKTESKAPLQHNKNIMNYKSRI